MAAFIGPLISGVVSLITSLNNPSNQAAQGNVTEQKQEQGEQSQEYQNMMQIFGQLQPFFEQYMSQGSPILNQVQQGSAAQLARSFGGQQGQAREALRAQGYGSAPSGTEAGMMGDMATGEATASSQQYLQNLLANENMKFQAASGLQGLGSMMKPSTVPYIQNQPMSNQGAGIGMLGTALQNLISGSSSSSSGTSGGASNGTVFSPSGVMTSGYFNPGATGGYGSEDTMG